MTTQQRLDPQQLPLLTDLPAERWFSPDEAGDLFTARGVDETVLMARVESGAVRSRLSGSGLELHPLDVDRWARIEGEIVKGLSRRNGGDQGGIRAK